MKIIKKILSWPFFIVGMILLVVGFSIFEISEKLCPIHDPKDNVDE